MCHYLLIDQYTVFAILDISCSKCREIRRKCRNTHYNEGGYYDVYDLIPVLYFTHYVAKWEWMYERLVKYMGLKFIDVDESWPYHVFKKKKLKICYAAQIGGSIIIISLRESGGVYIVDVSFVKVSHQIVMEMVGHEKYYFFLKVVF